MHGDTAARARRPRRLEYAVVVTVLLLLAGLLTAFKLIRIDLMYGDSAMLFQATENLAFRGEPVSQVQEQIVHYQNVERFMTLPVGQIAAHPEAFFGYRTPGTERSVLLGHEYLVLYPLAQLVRILPVRIVLLGAVAFGFAAVPALAFVFLRRRGVPVFAALCFCLLAVSHPAWWQAVLWGQFYPDRLFVVAGFVLMVVTTWRTRRAPSWMGELWLLVAGVACASVNERGALVAGIFLIVYTVLYWKTSRLAAARLAFGIALFAYGYVVIKFVLPGGSDYGGFLPNDIAGLAAIPTQPLFRQLMPLFVLETIPFLLLAAFEWRALVVALVLMIPNVIGNIGGAEKVGWVTHYPSFLLPALLWAAMVGYASLLERFPGRRALAMTATGTLALVVLIACVDPNVTQPLSIGPQNVLAKSVLGVMPEQVKFYIISSTARNELRTEATQMEAAVPPGSVVSSIEAGMPHLYRNRMLDYFPEGLDRAGFAALGAVPSGTHFAYNGAVMYLGPAEQTKLNELVEERLRRDGYDVDHPMRFPALGGMAIVKRLRP